MTRIETLVRVGLTAVTGAGLLGGSRVLEQKVQRAAESAVARFSETTECKIDFAPKTIYQAFDPNLGVEAINSGKLGSIYNPPFVGATVDGKYHFIAGRNEDGTIDWDYELDSRFPYEVAGYWSRVNPETGEIEYIRIDTCAPPRLV